MCCHAILLHYVMLDYLTLCNNIHETPTSAMLGIKCYIQQVNFREHILQRLRMVGIDAPWYSINTFESYPIFPRQVSIGSQTSLLVALIIKQDSILPGQVSIGSQTSLLVTLIIKQDPILPGQVSIGSQIAHLVTKLVS